MTHELWATLNQKMVEYLDSVSLKNLVDQQRARQPAVLHDMREDAAQQPVTVARGKSGKQEKPARARMVNSVFSLAQS
jgi:Rrf2 family iron-sulfur cluster assembly transcriptional regulator